MSSPRVSSPTGRRKAEEMRLQKDLSELDLPSNVRLSFPRGVEHMCEFEVALTPDEGCYAGGTFVFMFRVPESYPSDPPRVKCLTQVFHPAIDTEGHVDLSFLRDEWRPDMSIKTVIYGLHRLFLLPDTDDALNTAAGSLLHNNRSVFEQAVHDSVLSGATIHGKYYPAAVGERNVQSRNED